MKLDVQHGLKKRFGYIFSLVTKKFVAMWVPWEWWWWTSWNFL